MLVAVTAAAPWCASLEAHGRSMVRLRGEMVVLAQIIQESGRASMPAAAGSMESLDLHLLHLDEGRLLVEGIRGLLVEGIRLLVEGIRLLVEGVQVLVATGRTLVAHSGAETASAIPASDVNIPMSANALIPAGGPRTSSPLIALFVAVSDCTRG